jgi:L-glutamine---4-(methylsulfanyl)-2-oxobutanoate aminotransferase
MFFDNNIFFNFMYRVREAGIHIPIIPGIMPITKRAQVKNAYYVLVDVSEFGVKDDVKFCEWLAQYVGVAAVPGSSFFREDVNNLIRFHFAKQDDTLNEAINRLAGLRKAVAEAGDVEWR